MHLLLVPVARLGVRHPFVWRVLPFLLLASGAFAFAWLGDHYAWGNGTRLLIGLLALALFVLIAAPLALLPDLRRRRDEEMEAEFQAGESMMEDLRADIATRQGARFRIPR